MTSPNPISALAGQQAAQPGNDVAPDQEQVQKPAIAEEDIDRLLLKLINEGRTPHETIRRSALMEASESREFWKGNQHGTWLESQGAYIDVLNQGPLADDLDDDDLYAYVYNVYQAAGLIIMSPMLASGVPGTQFVPENGNDVTDRGAAENASRVRDYLHRQPWFNSLKNRLRTIHLLYTDGLVLAYTRHLRDEAFGTETYDKVAMVDQQLRPAGYDCGDCGEFNISAPPDDPAIAPAGSPAPGNASGSASGNDQPPAAPSCANCGASFQGQQATPPISAQVPQVVGQESVPAGREIVDLYGVLETILPYREDCISALPWAGIEVEVDVAALRAAYQDLADKINPGYAPEAADGELARRLRLSAQSAPNLGTPITGGQDSRETCTYSRFWVRPKQFFAIKDKDLRDELLGRFSKGVRVEYTGSLMLKKVPESMDEHLTLIHAYPGDGMHKPSIGGSLKDPQEIMNNAINLGQEAEAKSAIPPIYRDSEMIGDAAVTKRARPGEDIPVKVPAGKNLSASLWQPNWKTTDQSIRDSMDMGREAQQELAGAVGALAGESMENMRTARGYAQAGKQANQRLAMAYSACNTGWAEIDRQLVMHFMANRSQAVQYTVPSQNSPDGFDSVEIAMEFAAGKFNCVYPEADESVPVTQEQIASGMMSVLQSGVPALQAWISAPENLTVLRRAMGLKMLKIPGEDYRNRTQRIIAELLKQQPITIPAPPPQLGAGVQPGAQPGQTQTGQMQPGQATPGQSPAQPPQQPQVQPSIQLDPFLDEPGQVVQFTRDWCVSQDGVRAERSNPSGWQNVLAYGRMAQQLQQAQMQQQMAQQAAQQPPPKGAVPASKPPQPPPGADHPSIPNRVM